MSEFRGSRSDLQSWAASDGVLQKVASGKDSSVLRAWTLKSSRVCKLHTPWMPRRTHLICQTSASPVKWGSCV